MTYLDARLPGAALLVCALVAGCSTGTDAPSASQSSASTTQSSSAASPAGPPPVEVGAQLCTGRKVVESGQGNAALNDAVRLPDGLVVCVLWVDSAVGEPETLFAGKEVTSYRATVMNETAAPVPLTPARGIIVTDAASSHGPHSIVREMTTVVPETLPAKSAITFTVTDSIAYSALDDYLVIQFGAMFWAYPDRTGR